MGQQQPCLHQWRNDKLRIADLGEHVGSQGQN